MLDSTGSVRPLVTRIRSPWKSSRGIGRDALVEVLVLLLDAGQQGRDLARIVEGEAQHRPRPVRVAAAHLARRLLEHQHALGAVLLRRDGGGERRIAGADDDHVIV